MQLREKPTYKDIIIPRWSFKVKLVITSQGVYLPIVTFCQHLGISESRQIQKLRDDPDYAPMCERLIVPTPKGDRETWCIKRVALAGFFNSINPNRIRKELRAGWSEFRLDCMYELDRAFFGEVPADNPVREVAQIEAGFLAHGRFLEERIATLEERYNRLFPEGPEEHEVGEGEFVCPCCGCIIDLKLLGRSREDTPHGD